jgi:phenylacetic acid degradation operon negative regulatory protein
MHPTWRNLHQSYGAWEHNSHIGRTFARLEKRQLVERQWTGQEWILRLTDLGRVAALGGHDPVARWQRSWDGHWRLFLFDIPARYQSSRRQLIRWLRSHGFGYLQNSVWITPDPVSAIEEALAPIQRNTESFLIMQGRPAAMYDDQAIVDGAWDFPMINKLYHDYCSTAAIIERKLGKRLADSEEIKTALSRERMAWSRAIECDPLLPEALLPADYLGRTAWQTRRRVLKCADTLLKI